jgi:hypothetical protein
VYVGSEFGGLLCLLLSSSWNVVRAFICAVEAYQMLSGQWVVLRDFSYLASMWHAFPCPRKCGRSLGSSLRIVQGISEHSL